jgi:hypothetical protein
MKLWLAAVFCVAVLAGQNVRNESNYLGQTWVGLLVSSTCPAAKHTPATAEADRTVSARVTTPDVDASGTRGSSETGKADPAVRGDVPQTGDLSMGNSRKIKDPGWKQARRQASSLDAACHVGPDTRQFALMLNDGTLLRFDDAANSKIIEQLKSRGVSEKSKIFRAQVVGKLDNGAVALDEIRM